MPRHVEIINGAKNIILPNENIIVVSVPLSTNTLEIHTGNGEKYVYSLGGEKENMTCMKEIMKNVVGTKTNVGFIVKEMCGL